MQGPAEAAIVADDQAGVAANQLRLGMLATGKVFFTMTDAQGSDHGLRTGSAYNLVSSRSLIPGGWTHVAIVQDGKDFTLFLDAVESRRLTLEPFTRGTVPALPLRLGSRFAPVDDSIAFEPFAGDLDEVRIWKVARTAAQLAASRTQGLAESDYPDLLRYFRLEAGKGTADRDAVTDAGLALQPGATWVTTTPF